MNFLLMLGMMGLMLIFFHGRGHHKSSGEPNHHAAKPAVAPTAPTESTEGSRPPGESRRHEPTPGPEGAPKAEPAPPPAPPPTDQTE